MAEIQNYKCPACGAPLRYDTEAQRLKCDWCESSYTVAEMEQRIREQNEAKQKRAAERENAAAQPTAESGADADAPAEEFASPGDWDSSELDENWNLAEDAVRLYHCPSCGAELICDDTLASTSCPYCGNAVVLSDRLSGGLRPDYVIPFKLDKEQAIEALRRHYKGKILLPREFVSENHISEVRGVYVPFWLFDGEMFADVRFHATRSHSHREGEYRVTTTDHFDVRRSGSVLFRNIPVDAATKMPDGHMDAIEPFDYSEMKPFNAGYLPGFLANRYDVEWRQSAERAEQRAQQTALDAMRNQVGGYATCTLTNAQFAMRYGKVHYALLPVWMLNTGWRGQNYLFAVNGQTGKTVGDLPMSMGRFLGLFAAIAAGISALTALILFL